MKLLLNKPIELANFPTLFYRPRHPRSRLAPEVRYETQSDTAEELMHLAKRNKIDAQGVFYDQVSLVARASRSQATVTFRYVSETHLPWLPMSYAVVQSNYRPKLATNISKKAPRAARRSTKLPKPGSSAWNDLPVFVEK